MTLNLSKVEQKYVSSSVYFLTCVTNTHIGSECANQICRFCDILRHIRISGSSPGVSTKKVNWYCFVKGS